MGNGHLATAQSDSDGEYREQVLTVEPRGIERVHETERHGNVRSLFTLWLSANVWVF